MSENNAITDAMRSSLRELFARVLAEAGIDQAFERHVSCERGVLRICEDLYVLPDYERVFVVSLGKAAHTMAASLVGRLGQGAVQGIITAPTQPDVMLPGFAYFQGGHPLPTAGSLRAAESILWNLQQSSSTRLVIFLLSGGGSALVEKPIHSDLSLEDMAETYRVLVNCGASITQINAIRKHLSAVKGGRLAEVAVPSRQVSIMVSDVPDNALDSLASGPTMPDSTTVDDCYALAQQYGLLERFPACVSALFRTRALEETPKEGDPIFSQSRWWPILSNATAQRTAVEQALAAGFSVEMDNSCDDWDYARAADHLLDRLHALRQRTSRACIVSGGEVTVQVANGGRGGRNQQFALYCATQIAGENIAVLSAGTDGIDGNSTAAGAIADGTTLARARAQGLDAEKALREFDAYPLFAALDDAIVTGPTGNNLRDIRVLVAY